MKILAFGASTSKASINKQLAAYATAQFENATVEVLDLNDYFAPVFENFSAKNGIIDDPLKQDFHKLVDQIKVTICPTLN